MSIKLNKYSLPDETINQMKNTMHKSRQINSELGFTLCADQKDNLMVRNICSGKICNIEIETKCDKGEKYAGTYHTHHNKPSYASANDLIKCGTMHNICIGGADYHRCFIWIYNHITGEKYNEYINLLNKGIAQIDDSVHEKNFECIKEFGELAYVERTIPEIDKTILEQKQELRKAKQEKAPLNTIKEMEKIVKSNLNYRSNIISKTIKKIAELAPKYYEEKILW